MLLLLVVLSVSGGGGCFWDAGKWPNYDVQRCSCSPGATQSPLICGCEKSGRNFNFKCENLQKFLGYFFRLVIDVCKVSRRASKANCAEISFGAIGI